MNVTRAGAFIPKEHLCSDNMGWPLMGWTGRVSPSLAFGGSGQQEKQPGCGSSALRRQCEVGVSIHPHQMMIRIAAEILLCMKIISLIQSIPIVRDKIYAHLIRKLI